MNDNGARSLKTFLVIVVREFRIYAWADHMISNRV